MMQISELRYVYFTVVILYSYHESFKARKFHGKLYTQTFTKNLRGIPHTLHVSNLYVKLHVTMASSDDASSLTTESCVCGFHAYRDTWEPENGELHQCFMKQTILKTGMYALPS